MIRHAIRLELVGGRSTTLHFGLLVPREDLQQVCNVLEHCDEVRSATVDYQPPEAIRAHDADLANRFKIDIGDKR